MKRYNLMWYCDILIPNIGLYYADTLIDFLRERRGIKNLGWFEVEGAFNDFFRVRIVNKKKVKKNEKI